MPDIVQAWRGASAKMVELGQAEAGIADNISVGTMPDATSARTREIEADALFKASFSDTPISFNVVEIDKLVAPQREVNLDYVDLLRKRIPGDDTIDLIEFCIGPRAEPPELKVLQNAQNQVTFSSRSLDLRFLGGSPKSINEDDMKVAHLGGQPAEVITLLVGFGAAPINAWQVGKRLVLANGFHRIIALRTQGISKVPLVVRHIANAEIEFPENYLGLPRAYLLQNPRPVLIRDFFDDELVVEVRLKPRKKILKIGWGQEDSVVPD